MKSKFIIINLLLVSVLSLFSQEQELDTEKYLKTLSKIDLGFSGLGISVETPVSEKVLLEFAAGVGAGYKINQNFRYRFYFDDPALFGSVHAKYYYNQQQRVDKGRPVSYNAGNFMGLKVKYASPTLREERTWHTLLLGFHWGMQRKMGKHFLFQYNIGLGFAIDLENKTSTHVTPFPDTNFRISYVLPFL